MRTDPRASAVLTALLIITMVGCAPAAPVTPSLGMTAAPAAVGDDSTMYKGNPGRTGEMPGHAITSQPVTLWTVALGGPAISAPAVVDGVAYVATGDRRVIAVDVTTGAQRWEARFDDPVRSSPAVADESLFVNDEGGALTALAIADGSVEWTVDEAIAAESMPLVMESSVIIGTQHGDLLALDADTGQRRWAFATGGELTHSPSSDGRSIFIGSADGTLYAVDAATGERRWSFAGQAQRWTTAAVRDGSVFTVGHEIQGGGDALFAIDAVTGKVQWQTPAAQPLYAPSAGPGLVLVADSNGVVHAFHPSSGQVRWETEIGGYARPAPAVVGSMAYLFGGAREAIGLDIETGTIRWRMQLDGTVEYGTTAADGRLFAVTTAGTLFGLGSSDLAVATPMPSVKATPTPAIQAMLVGEGEQPPDGLSGPTGVAADPEGRLWVAEGYRDGFAIFESDGRFIERWGTPGSKEGQFDFDNANSGNPTADIAFGPDGDFYVADTGNFRIQHFDRERRFLEAWGGFGQGNGQFAIPFALDLDADRNVYVTSGNGNVQVFEPDGDYLRTIGAPGAGDGELANAGLAVDGDRLLVADWDNHRIAVFGLDGRFQENWLTGEIGDPNAVAVAPDGTIYVTSGGVVRVIGSTGTLLGSFAASRAASFVDVLPDGRVVVTAWRSDPPGTSESLQIYEVTRPS